MPSVESAYKMPTSNARRLAAEGLPSYGSLFSLGRNATKTCSGEVAAQSAFNPDDPERLQGREDGSSPSKLKALIFNMQKFSLNDGPGIRTVVFFKGCPLRCRWCSNPESQLRKPQIQWEPRSCIHCHHCEELCPRSAISFIETSGKERIRIDEGRCNACGRCVIECPKGALSCRGVWRSVDDVLQFVAQDKVFYEESGGGLTLSGGEPLLWPEFCCALLGAASAQGIDSCIETTAYADPQVFRRVASCLDHMFIDMKQANSSYHRAATGVSNELIKANTSWAISSGKDVTLRLPVIPGFNDSREDAEAFCGYLKDVGATRVQILPFHQYGEAKYEELGYDYELAGMRSLHAEDLSDFQRIFIEHKLDAYF